MASSIGQPRWLLAVACLLSPLAVAADWRFEPGAALRETYTDNVTLNSAGSRRSDFITDISPHLLATINGSSVKARLDYTLQNLGYARSADHFSSYHRLNAFANTEVVDELLYLDSRAGITQQNLSAFGPQTDNNLNVTNNRSEVRSLSISPYLRHRWGQTATGELRYGRDWLRSNTQALNADHQDRLSLSVNSGPAFATLGWGANYTQQRAYYDGGRTVNLSSATSNFTYRLSSQLGLVSTLGYETNDYATLGPKPEGLIWLAGVKWTPSPRTNLDARLGKRFYGNTYSLTASQRTRTGVFSLGYNEELTTVLSPSVQQLNVDTSTFLNDLWRSSIPDPQARQAFVDAFIRANNLPGSLAQNVLSLSNRVYLQKGLQASLAYRTTRDTALLSFSHIDRRAQTGASADIGLPGAALLGLEDHTRQASANLIVAHQLTPRLSATASLAYSRVRSLTVDNTSSLKTASFSLTRQLDLKTQAVIEYRRRNQTLALNAGTVEENAITASIATRF
ncbi:TIGR03016 family PEP-CTERM system-associated outer membrane protein [Noviherbaspirillum humi]|uniref:TIGR03016 family PEP-CTERM system-associated outer membrane protein n=1 Tax=Noviherbaspirillum humi TaxID=1688639 RepID=UPI0015952A27|nr:TIGR03016 family PEP-CTERM system-associated outer membrane protein [Noviherbaspirillum humi]